MNFNFNDPSDDTPSEMQGRKLRRSCELCRSSKGKCIPSGEDMNRCQRCVKDGKQCVFLEARPRPKRAKNSRIRVAEMEQKLDGLMALLSAKQEKKEASATSKPPSPPSEPAINPMSLTLSEETIPEFSTNFEPSMPLPQFDSRAISNLEYPDFSFPSFENSQIQDVISKCIIDFNQAEQAIAFYKTKAANFPFVLVPPNMSLDSLRRERPFLLLCILTYTAALNAKLQSQLDLEVRETLSRKVVVNGETSLDLLQGILVYLAWYHYYFNPEKQQVYQLSSMACAMAVDLGITTPNQVTTAKGFLLTNPAHMIFIPKLSAEESETKRALLGCYYLSNSICHGLRKPSILKYSDYMGTSAKILAQASRPGDPDFLLPYTLQLQRLAEEISHAFNYELKADLPQEDATRIEILVNAFEKQLDQCLLTFPPEAWNNIGLKLSFLKLKVYVCEVGFHAKAPPDVDLFASQPPLGLWYYSTARSETMIKCLKYCKDFLDYILSLPSVALVDFGIPDFLSFAYAFLVLGAFATKIDSPSLDEAQIRRIANFQWYTEQLGIKVMDVITITPKQGSNDYLGGLHALLEKSKSWQVQLTTDPSYLGYRIVGRAEFGFMDIVPTVLERCCDYTATKMMPQPGLCSNEKWEEILSGWTSSIDASTMSVSIGSSSEQ